MDEPLLKPGRNCWRVERADRLAFLIDGADYFRALHTAITRARRSIILLDWEIDPGFELLRDHAPDGWPTAIERLLHAVLRRNRHLRVHILDWDFAMLNGGLLDLIPRHRPSWRPHRRLRFVLDDHHPLGASHHQKVVVIDDTVAFCGGLDITRGRWDTPEHLPNDPRHRTHPRRPYHDVQTAVSGPVAGALGELARERWRRATGRQIPAAAPVGEDPWPPDLTPDLVGVDVGISRTSPRYLDYPEVREVERLFLDSIGAARRSIYIENQYFTSGRIGDALARRLEEPEGPDVVVALPLETDSWLSQSTMDVMRRRLITRLRRSDRHGRLGVYYAHIPNAPLPLNLHAKVMVIDETLARVGSANLNNRSMGLDTECDLAIEARGDERTSRAIAGLRQRLLAEHLGVEPARFAAALEAHRSLLGAIESLRVSDGRSLRVLEAADVPHSDYLQSTEEMIDPERPVDPEEFVRTFIAADTERPRARRRIAFSIGLLVAVLALTAAWRLTPLREYLDLQTVLAATTQIQALPASPAIVLGVFLLASLVSFPITLLIVVTMLAFGPWAGAAYAVTGCLLGAAAGFGAGHALGRDTVTRLAGPRINELSTRLARRGIFAVIAVRVIPVAPFTVVNLVAGASHIRLRDFMIGTLIGILPGIAAVALFTDRIVASLTTPDTVNFVLLAVVIVLIGACAFFASRWLRRRADRDETPRTPDYKGKEGNDGNTRASLP